MSKNRQSIGYKKGYPCFLTKIKGRIKLPYFINRNQIEWCILLKKGGVVVLGFCYCHKKLNVLSRAIPLDPFTNIEEFSILVSWKNFENDSNVS